MNKIIPSQKSVSSKEIKPAKRIIANGINFFSIFKPFKEYVGILEIIKIAGINKKNLKKFSLDDKSKSNLKLIINGNNESPAAAGVEIPEKNFNLKLLFVLSILEILNFASLDDEQIA